MKTRRLPAPQARRPISDALLQSIRSQGLTPYAVATSAGVAPSVVSRFVSGERDLTLDSADAVAAALNMELRARRGRVKIVK